jgi:hypothetical protein
MGHAVLVVHMPLWAFKWIRTYEKIVRVGEVLLFTLFGCAPGCFLKAFGQRDAHFKLHQD